MPYAFAKLFPVKAVRIIFVIGAALAIAGSAVPNKGVDIIPS